MEKVKKELAEMFDGMLDQVGAFKKRTYKEVFAHAYETYGGIIPHIVSLCGECTEEEKEQTIEKLAAVLPDHAYEQLREVPRIKRDRVSIDYNMNMVVYVMPLLTCTKEACCEKLVEKTVELWNEKKLNSMTLGVSSYETIAGGFRKGLCYITTAVCEYQKKPDDCYELTMLRGYRDGYLMKSEDGRRLVEEYYDTAPYLVCALRMQKDVSGIYEELYNNYLSPCITCIEEEKYEECRRIYVDMVRGLQKKYLYS